MLIPYGISPADLSLCRTLQIYSVEALYGLEGQGVVKLGMRANALKDAARKFMAASSTGAAMMDEMSILRARIAELEAGGQTVTVPADVAEPDADEWEGFPEVHHR